MGNCIKVKESSNQNQKTNVLIVPHSKNSIEEEYDLLNIELGKGSFGKVIKAFHKGSKEFRAIKIMKKSLFDEAEKNAIFYEINILKNLDHPNIVKVSESFQDDENIYICMEYVEGIELFDKILELGKFNEKQAANIFKKLVLTIKYCHENNIIHRDLKPENILFDGENPIVIDFGLSIKLKSKNQMLDEILGSPFYVAPEVLNESYNFSCDVWSLGIILFIMLTGYPPFNGKNNKIIFNKIKYNQYDTNNESYKNISKKSKDLIEKILVLDPSSRLSLDEILEHDWLININDLGNENFNKNILLNLTKFNYGNKLKTSIINFYSRNYLKNNQIKKLTRVFNTLDTNGNGKLSKKELEEGSKNILKGKELSEFIKVIQNYEHDEIEYSVFISATIDKLLLFDKEKIKKFFDKLDYDKSGKINFEELQILLEGGVDDNQEKVIEKIIKEFDKDNDNEIDFQEFFDGLSNLKLD